MILSRTQQIAINISFAILLIIFSILPVYGRLSHSVPPGNVSDIYISQMDQVKYGIGLGINFLSPAVTGSGHISRYIITLRDTTGDKTKTYLLDQLYFTGKRQYKNYSSDITPSYPDPTRSHIYIFIKKSGIATLIDQHSYIVGIRAVNNFLPARTETFSKPIKYIACAQENETCQNWGPDTGAEAVTIISDSILLTQ